MDLLLVWLVMKGKPKYKIGDKVIISLSGFFNTLNNGEHVGEVYIVDPYGTFDDPSDVSYDVMIHEYRHPSCPDEISDCLCKHITEKDIKPYNDETRTI